MGRCQSVACFQSSSRCKIALNGFRIHWSLPGNPTGKSSALPLGQGVLAHEWSLQIDGGCLSAKTVQDAEVAVKISHAPSHAEMPMLCARSPFHRGRDASVTRCHARDVSTVQDINKAFAIFANPLFVRGFQRRIDNRKPKAFQRQSPWSKYNFG